MSAINVNLQYEREDWTLFRTVPTLCQAAGVAPALLRRLIAKELADNGIDPGGACRVGLLPGGAFYVEDDGPGIGGGPEDVARLFSFRRPLVSSKLKRRPTRGALGNGLRVVAGAVYASAGDLRVITNGWALDLSPQESGDTLARATPCERRAGARVELRLGPGIPEDAHFLCWAQTAIRCAGREPIYCGKPSVWFHDSVSFFELLKAAGAHTVREVMEEFQGRDRPRVVGRFGDRLATSLTFDESEELLKAARDFRGTIVPAKKLSLLGDVLPGYYAKVRDTLYLEPGRGSVSAELPYTVEAWCACPSDGKDSVTVLVNRSPAAAVVQVRHAKNSADVTIFGCNLGYDFKVGRKPVALTINVQIPYMPITSNGKEPDLDHFITDLDKTITSAAGKLQKANRTPDQPTNGLLPRLRKGRPSDEDSAKYEAGLARFADRLKEIESRLDFKAGSRGWCYILENEHGLPKGDFDKAQRLITDCRKSGLLPIDFTAEDEARGADNLEELDDEDPTKYASALAEGLHDWEYAPVSFWDFQHVYIQAVVEKIDLKSLFMPVCAQYHVPIMNSRGWSDLNQRAGLMRRFKYHEERGRRPVLLQCGDHDPVGLDIPDRYREHFEELRAAVGWSPNNLIIERFGLNADFIEEHGLTWIDGLRTASGNDLGDPSHKQHKAAFVQEYIKKFGKRKVEANALVVRPEAGRRLCREAIRKYLNMDAIQQYEQRLEREREHVKAALPPAIKKVLRLMQGTCD